MAARSSSRAASSSSSSSSSSGGKQPAPLKELKESSEYKSAIEEINAIKEHLRVPAPTFDDGLNRIIIIDGLPKTTKVAALRGAVTKKLAPGGWDAYPVWPAEVTPDQFFVLPEVGGTTLGHCFLEYPTPEAAAAAVGKLNDKAFDKMHKLRVIPYTEVERLRNVSEEFVAPTIETAETDNPRWWLLEEQMSDQYAICHGTNWNVDVFWNETKTKPEKIANKPDCERFLWSPQGTYLATFHGPGIILWSGPKFGPPIRFKHENVDRIEFSPCENYLMTCAPEGGKPQGGGGGKQSAAAAAADKKPRTLIIWDVRTLQHINQIPIDAEDKTWPVFKWSHDDKFFGRKNENGITIIDTATMQKCTDSSGKRKDLLVPNISDFTWSPARNLLAAFVASADTARPARVDIIEMPSRRVLQTRTVFNVESCSFIWHPQGDFLCALLNRHGRAKKKHTTNIEVFRMRQKDIPIDTVELQEDVLLHNEQPLCSWEPQGTRFVVMQRDAAASKNIAHIYNVTSDKIVPVTTLGQDKQLKATNFHWAPSGRFLVFSGLGNFNGHLEFFDTHDLTLMGEADHFSATNCCWDPTGRYFTSYVTLNQAMENGYIIWSFSGKQIWKVLKDKFRHFEWRPRPATLLKKTQVQAIKKNLKKYSDRYVALDLEVARERREHFFRERAEQSQQFRRLESDLRTHWTQQGHIPSIFDHTTWKETTQVVDKVIETKEEFVE